MIQDIHIKKEAGICPKCKKRNHPLAMDQPGDICDKCQEELVKKSSIILCNTCNHIAGFVECGKSDGGFEFQIEETYHVTHCKRCTPTLTDFKIIEVEEFMKENKQEGNTGIFTETKPGKREEKKNG